MPFSPDYIRLVLRENFEDAKTLLLAPLMAINEAHLVMLAQTGIVSREDARAIRTALAGIDRDAVARAEYDGSCEDLFFYVDRLVGSTAGRDAAGRLHTARSRNDIDMTMYRMRVREWTLDLVEAVLAARHALVEIASEHRESILPAHTHTQPAQPTTLAHYLLAVIEQLERDTVRLTAAFRTVNQCPLGACAITGTGFPIDRSRTSNLLGFDAPTGNTYGSIASVDYLLEPAAAASTLVIGLGRFVQDMLLWSTREVGYVRLSDALVQVSSIMPQKRNPVALEHARALSSKAAAELTAIAMTVHNTPFGDIVDTEDDLQPLVAQAFRDAARGVALVAVAMAGATFDTARMRARAAAEWVSVTELADTLTREQNLAFKHAHEIVSRLVNDGRTGNLAARLSAAAAASGAHVHGTDAEVEAWLSPEHFIAVRHAAGEPAPAATAVAVAAARENLDRDAGELRQWRERLAMAEGRRRAAVDAI